MESCEEKWCSSASSSSDNPGRKELSLEQRRRIDHNFRAAKAILSRKRPHTEPSLSPICHPSPTWAPLSSHERSQGLNQDVQGLHSPPSAFTKLAKTCDMQSSTKPVVLNGNRLPSKKEVSSNLLHANKVSANQKVFLDAENPHKHFIDNFDMQNTPSSINKPKYAYTDSVTLRVPLGSINCNTSPHHLKGLPALTGSLDAHKTLPKAVPKQGMLPLNIEEALLPDTAIDEILIAQLDAFCSGGAPLVQLPTNRPLKHHLNSISDQSSFSSASTEKSFAVAVLPSAMEPSVCKLHVTSLTKVGHLAKLTSVADMCNSSEAAPHYALSTSRNSQPEVSSMVDTVNNLGELNQSNTSGTSTICPNTRDLGPQSLQGNAENIQADHDWSYSCLSPTNETLLQPNSESDILAQISNPVVRAASVHPSSLTISETSSNELSASVSEVEVMPAYIQNLNDSQKEAVLSDTHKPLLILAGPGSGKTSTMVARLLRLLSEGVLATNILAMTFTTAAATEMKDRVGMYVGKLTSKELNVSTFHSFCLQLCRSHAEKLGRSSDFLVYGHGQQRRAVIEATRLALSEIQPSKDVAAAANAASYVGSNSCCDQLIDPKLLKERAKKWDKFVSQAKAAGRTPEFYEHLGNISGAAVLRHYNATLQACDALDYHDFINCAVTLLRDNSEVLEQCLSMWTCLLVDEFQDTSKMQYELLCLLASHKRVTVVGDDDQTIFSFNGADSNNFEAFRTDFSELKEVRLQHNYRSTRCIVEAATSLIGNNVKRCENKQAVTDNGYGEMITIKECRNDDAQCCFAIDTIITKAQMMLTNKPIYGNFAILYRRQVTGKIFQSALRSRKIPFNVHGVAFYRKKIVKIVVSMLWTVLDNEATYCSRVFKALYGGDKAEAKKVVEYVDKVAKASQCKFLEASRRIFTAKVSGTFSRRQIACGRKVLTLIDAVHRLARKEPTLSALVTAVINLIPQRSAFQKRAVVDADEGKFLNEDNDSRTVLEYFLDDVTDFLSNHFHPKGGEEEAGCLLQLKAFLDHMTLREHGNFKMRSEENKNSVTLTTMHQSKGLEWDTVFIVKANDSEIPLLHEARGSVCEGAMSIEEERRLFYVGMTRAKKKLYILYLTWDSNQQLLNPTRFLRELPRQLLDYQVDNMLKSGASVQGIVCPQIRDSKAAPELQHDNLDMGEKMSCKQENPHLMINTLASKAEEMELATSTDFLKGFNVDARSTIASIFHNWAKKPAFQDPKRLLDKVCFVLDERMRCKASKNKDTLRALKCCLNSDDAFLYAQHVLKWMQIPQEERALMLSEKQEYFQQRCAERSMGAASATPKQVSYLRSLGCTIDPTSRLHASRLIEQYKKL